MLQIRSRQEVPTQHCTEGKIIHIFVFIIGKAANGPGISNEMVAMSSQGPTFLLVSIKKPAILQSTIVPGADQKKSRLGERDHERLPREDLLIRFLYISLFVL